MVINCYRRLNVINFVNGMIFCTLKRFPSQFRVSFRCYIGRNDKNFYDILGVKRDATSKEIKGAYYELSKKYHPDTNRLTAGDLALKKFQEIGLAYETLGNKTKRWSYDRYLRGETTRPDTQTKPPSHEQDEHDELYQFLKRNEDIRRNYRFKNKQYRSQSDFDAYYRHVQNQYDEMKKSQNWSEKIKKEFEWGEKVEFKEFGRKQDGFTDFQKEMIKRQAMQMQQSMDSLINAGVKFTIVMITIIILTSIFL